MPIFNIGQSNPYKTPVLNGSYPANVTQLQQVGGSATFEVKIATAGIPDEYTYQWYVNDSAVAGATLNKYTKTGLTDATTYAVYCKVTNRAGTVQSRTAILTVQSAQPIYAYSGLASLIDDGNYNYRIKFLTSGTLTFTNLGCFANGIDVFCVGGGGGGGTTGGYSCPGGGGGGYTNTARGVGVSAGVAYAITVGAGGPAGVNGGDTGALGCYAAGGQTTSGSNGAPGGSGGGGGGGNSDGKDTGIGGDGGSDGGNGYDGRETGYRGSGGLGQGTTTREFGESWGTVYAGGGGGTGKKAGGTGGIGGGGNGGTSRPTQGTNGTENTGGGGGGKMAGGSGIVVIRNAR